MIYSLKSNARYQLIVITCAVLGLVYVFLQNGFRGTSVKSLVMALAYCVGLVQAVLLLGHGLVAVPRRLFLNAAQRLKKLQLKAPKVYEKLEDAITEMRALDNQVSQLKGIKNGLSWELREWIEELADNSTLTAPIQVSSQALDDGSNAIPAVVTERYLADLTKWVNRARHKTARFTETWGLLIREAADTQAILDSHASKRLEFWRPSTEESLFFRAKLLTPRLRYLMYGHVLPAIRIFFGFVLALASCCIIWSELVKFAAPKLSIISLTIVRYPEGDEGRVNFFGQMMAIFGLFYMCASILASFDDVKIWGNRALVRRNTYGESACWYAGQIAKLTVPLTYNFLTFMPPKIHEKTEFYKFLGKLIVLTPLGKWFDYVFPILILFPACATLFNFYGRIKSILGFGIVEDDEESSSAFGTGSWREGRDLIDQELQGRTNLDSTALLEGTSYSSPSTRPDAAERSNLSGRSQPRETTPKLHIPPAERERSPPRQAQRLAAATQAAEEEDESIFSGFAHRLKNTIDAVERPDWIPELGKRPKWMGGANDSNGESSGRAESGRGLGRWFGGRPADGRLRL